MTFEHVDERPLMACGVCGRILDLIEPDAPDEEPRWEHSSLEGSPVDHPVVAVEARHLRPIARCDFCLRDVGRFAWAVPAQSFRILDLNYNSVGDWQSCSPCAQLIQRDAWNHLETRVARAIDGGSPTNGTRYAVAKIYAELRKNITGKPKKVQRYKA